MRLEGTRGAGAGPSSMTVHDGITQPRKCLYLQPLGFQGSRKMGVGWEVRRVSEVQSLPDLLS